MTIQIPGNPVPTISIRNTIVSNNTPMNCRIGAGTATFTSQGNNLTSDASACSFNQPGDQVSTNPQIGALQDNGGFNRTMLPATGSPAIDRGLNAGCPAVGQRGATRPAEGDGNGAATCDIGAVEVAGAVVIPPEGGGGTTPIATTPAPTVTPVPPPAPVIVPQVFQNPGAVAIVQGGIGNGTRNNTPVPSRPAVVDPSSAVAPATGPLVITPPRTGDAGLAPHATFSIFDGAGAQPKARCP